MNGNRINEISVTVVPQKFASLDFRRARAHIPSFRLILGPYPRVFSHVSGFKIQIRFQRTGSRSREIPERRVAPNAFEQLREIELRVAATLTPPEVDVSAGSCRVHIYREP